MPIILNESDKESELMVLLFMVPLFTVFTPTYNRADTLHRVFESLQAQTLRDFEWLIVDDGSSDHTGALVEHWRQTADFPIRYFWQPNQGKHVAFNRGVQEARGELFVIIDSDDACIPSTLARFAFHWSAIPEEDQGRFWAVMALCIDVNGDVIGGRFPQDRMDSSLPELIYRYKMKGDKCAAQRTHILRQFPFPVMDQVKFIAEGVVWIEIGCRYQIRFINEPLYIAYRGEVGRPDQLTRAPVAKMAAGGALLHQSIMNKELRWFRHAPLAFLRSAALYSRFSFYTGQSLLAQAGGLLTAFGRALWLLGLPIGYIFYLCDVRKPSKPSSHAA